MSSAPLLQVSGLSRRYGERVALADLSFEVAPGEIFGFLGPNGAGKSTAFQLIAGLLAPDAGEIRFHGVPVRACDASYRARLGVVHQSPSVDLLLTGEENLRLGAMLYGIAGGPAKERISQALKFMGLADRARDRVSTYSGGMRRRLEIARVGLHQPELLLMDEPSSGLDLATLRSLWDHLRSMAKQQQLSILVTTHNPEEAEYCDRLGVIMDGRLVATQTPEQLRRRIGGDVISIESRNGAAQTIAKEILTRFGGEVRVENSTVFLERASGHELIPKLVEAFPAGTLRAVGMRPPSLADAFAKLTGKSLS